MSLYDSPLGCLFWWLACLALIVVGVLAFAWFLRLVVAVLGS